VKSIELVCLLDRCNLDGTDVMSLDKCLKNGKPCYYLHVTEPKNDPNSEAWGKFKKNLKDKQ